VSDYQIRSASVFVGGLKMGTFTDGNLSIKSGDEPNFGDNAGTITYSDGVIQATFSADFFEPVQGLGFDLDAALLTKTILNISVGLINGKIYNSDWRPLDSDHTFTIKSGESKGKYNFGSTTPLTRT